MFLGTGFSIGGGFVGFMAVILIPAFGWRPWAVVCGFPAALFLLLSPFVPDTPRYYLVCGREDLAKKILKPACDKINLDLDNYHIIVDRQEPRGQFKDLFQPEYRRTTLIMLYNWFTLIFIYFGVVLAGSEIVRLKPHIEKPLFGDQSCHNMECKPLTLGDLYSIMYASLPEMACMIATAFIIEAIGRRYTFLMHYSIFAISTILLAHINNQIAILILIYFARAFSTTLSVVCLPVSCSGYLLVYIFALSLGL